MKSTLDMRSQQMLLGVEEWPGVHDGQFQELVSQENVGSLTIQI